MTNTDNKNSLTVNWVAPSKGEFTFTVVEDKNVSYYPASQLEKGTKSTNDEVLAHHAQSKPQVVFS